jgi:hypothetical protein
VNVIGRPGLSIVIILLAAVTVGAYLRLALGPTQPGIDFHAYWVAGHFVWEGIDPYGASLEKRAPKAPARYLDGGTPPQGTVKQFDTVGLPGNTATMLLMISPLSLLSWPTALSLWMALNVAAIPVIVLLLCRLMEGRLLMVPGLLLLFVAFVFIPSRQTVQAGQTSLIVTLFMVLAFKLSFHEGLVRRILTGAFLGVALSKPLLAFPLFLFFMVRKDVFVLSVGCLVQFCGMLIIAMAGNVTLHQVALSYIRFFQELGNPEVQGGMTLTAGIMKGLSPYSYLFIGAVTVVLFGLLIKWWRTRSPSLQGDKVAQICWLNVIILWNLLIFYHRRYDYVSALPFFAVAAFLGETTNGSFALNERQRWVLRAIASAIAGFWILPFYLLLGYTVYQVLFCLLTAAALFSSLWLLFRVPAYSAPGPPLLPGLKVHGGL